MQIIITATSEIQYCTLVRSNLDYRILNQKIKKGLKKKQDIIEHRRKEIIVVCVCKKNWQRKMVKASYRLVSKSDNVESQETFSEEVNTAIEMKELQDGV